MIVPLLTLLFGGTGGYFIGRARSLEKEKEAEQRQRALEQQLAEAKALPPADRPLPPIPRPTPKPGDVVVVEPDPPEGSPLKVPGPSPLPTEEYREPDRTAVIKLPVDAEDFDQLGDAICACYAALKGEAGPGVDVDAAALRDCLLEAVYPDFVWPPVPGDPVNAQLMWMIADHESRKALIGADLEDCPAGPATPIPPVGPKDIKFG